MVAGVIAAALRGSKKSRPKRQKIDRDEHDVVPLRSNVIIKPFPKFPPKWLTTKEAAALAAKKAANESLKKLILGQELQKQQRLKNQQQQQGLNPNPDAVSQISNENEDGPFGSSGNAYNAIYLGLVLICVGVVITFVGLGEKGFKTLELKMIGPVLCVIGLSCITIKIIHCSFPQMFKIPACFKKAKLRDSDQSNLMEKGVQNGHFGKKATSPKVLSPRVKLQSSKKSARPTSTIPNYIGQEDSSDDDDFDPGRSRPHSNRYNNAFEESPRLSSPSQRGNVSKHPAMPSSTTPVTIISHPSQQQAHNQQHNPQGRVTSPQNELLLSPQGLIL